eukprot:TRINITY_DN30033_c0_g1_i1.p1 TRINITY_DN30033_c0_g1~~TRINITY_DN30033_c0_g1_i1.p1  ORF type:complete len:104 (-),score=5.41 TRINITY_DN30033_c0_g1_i1:39-314(-)
MTSVNSKRTAHQSGKMDLASLFESAFSRKELRQQKFRIIACDITCVTHTHTHKHTHTHTHTHTHLFFRLLRRFRFCRDTAGKSKKSGITRV